MEINLSQTIKQLISVIILLILPLLLIILGVIFKIYNAWYFISMITWFGLGIILMTSIDS